MARTEDFDLGYTRRPKQQGKGIGWRTLLGASLFGAGASAAAMKAPEIMDLVRSNFGSERAVATPVGATTASRNAEIIPAAALPTEPDNPEVDPIVRLGLARARFDGMEVDVGSIALNGHSRDSLMCEAMARNHQTETPWTLRTIGCIDDESKGLLTQMAERRANQD